MTVRAGTPTNPPPPPLRRAAAGGRRRPARTAGQVVAVLAALVLALILGLAGPAGAHTDLERSEPPDGGTAAVDRTVLTLWFTEPIDPQASRFELRAADGARVALTVDITNDETGAFVEIGTSPLWRDTFVLEWSLLSNLDGHTTAGSIVFGAGIRPATTASGTVQLPGARTVALRWADLAALMLLIGAMAASHLAVGPEASAHRSGLAGHRLRRPLRRMHLMAAGAAGVALATGVLTVIDRVPRYGRSLGAWVDDAIVATLTGTAWGRLWMARETALAVLIVTLIAGAKRVSRGSQPDGRQPPEALAALTVAVGVEAWAGHAGALGRQAIPAIVASALHLVAAGVWAGGLAALVVAFLPPRLRPGAHWSPVGVWRRFSTLAAASLFVLVATGLYASGRHLASPGDLVATAYGRTLSAKIALAAAAAVLGGISSVAVNPALVGRLVDRLSGVSGRAGSALRSRLGSSGPPRLPARRLLMVEAALLLVGAIVTAAGLVSMATPREVAVADEARGGARSTTVDGVFVTLEVAPAGAGQSRVIVRARSLVRPEPAPIDGISVVLTPPPGVPLPEPVGDAAGSGLPAGTATAADLEIEATQVELGRYEITTSRLEPGQWQLAAVVQRGPLMPVIATFDWEVREPVLDRPYPLERALTAAAVLLVLGGAIALVLRRRTVGRAPDGPIGPDLDVPATPLPETEAADGPPPAGVDERQQRPMMEVNR